MRISKYLGLLFLPDQFKDTWRTHNIDFIPTHILHMLSEDEMIKGISSILGLSADLSAGESVPLLKMGFTWFPATSSLWTAHFVTLSLDFVGNHGEKSDGKESKNPFKGLAIDLYTWGLGGLRRYSCIVRLLFFFSLRFQ